MKVLQIALFLLSTPSVVRAYQNEQCESPDNPPGCTPPPECDGFWDCLGRKRRLSVISQTCTDFDYTVSVTVQGTHIMLAAEPQCGSLRNNKECKECGGYGFHTFNTEKDSKVLEKQVFELPEDKKNAELLPLTTMTLGNLLKAFEDTPVSNKRYSFFKNNCASFVIDLGKKIGVNPKDPAIVRFVSRKLSQESGTKVVAELSDHEEGRALIDGRGDQDAVIHDFVSEYIHSRV